MRTEVSKTGLRTMVSTEIRTLYRWWLPSVKKANVFCVAGRGIWRNEALRAAIAMDIFRTRAARVCSNECVRTLVRTLLLRTLVRALSGATLCDDCRSPRCALHWCRIARCPVPSAAFPCCLLPVVIAAQVPEVRYLVAAALAAGYPVVGLHAHGRAAARLLAPATRTTPDDGAVMPVHRVAVRLG